MPIDSIFGIGGTALNAQLIRMNTTASNLANAGTTAPNEQEAFKTQLQYQCEHENPEEIQKSLIKKHGLEAKNSHS
jgi:flagellar basal body rod protein FlgC